MTGEQWVVVSGGLTVLAFFNCLITGSYLEKTDHPIEALYVSWILGFFFAAIAAVIWAVYILLWVLVSAIRDFPYSYLTAGTKYWYRFIKRQIFPRKFKDQPEENSVHEGTYR